MLVLPSGCLSSYRDAGLGCARCSGLRPSPVFLNSRTLGCCLNLWIDRLGFGMPVLPSGCLSDNRDVRRAVLFGSVPIVSLFLFLSFSFFPRMGWLATGLFCLLSFFPRSAFLSSPGGLIGHCSVLFCHVPFPLFRFLFSFAFIQSFSPGDGWFCSVLCSTSPALVLFFFILVHWLWWVAFPLVFKAMC